MPQYRPPINSWYNQICVPDPITPFTVLAQYGYQFKKIKKQSKVDYIWYDRHRHVVEVWSRDQRKLVNAINMLKRLVIPNF